MDDEQTDQEVVESGPRQTRRPNPWFERLSSLMSRREDLRGAYPLADYVDEAIRWGA